MHDLLFVKYKDLIGILGILVLLVEINHILLRIKRRPDFWRYELYTSLINIC